jgi:hypothetical protein
MSRGRQLAAVAGAIGALAAAAPAAAQTARTSVAPKTPGSIDSNLNTRSGKLLGYLHGDLTKKGTGLGTFRPVPGSRQISLIVGLKAHRAGTNTVVIAHGSTLHMRLLIKPNHTISGSGLFNGRAVKLNGAAGEELPPLTKGMKMLVVGHPTGEGYRALRSFFKPVVYNPRKHTRHNFLRERREFQSYAALVFGRGITPHGIVTHKLLRAFYGASKWVIVAPATPSAQDALRDVHPYVPGSPSPLLAVRATGAAGSAQNVKPTVLYPTALGVPAPRSVLQAAERSRERWFIGELRQLDGAHMASAHQAQSGDPVNFRVPVNAAAIELAVPYYHEFAFSKTQNKALYQPCGWNQTTYNAWCTDTAYWKQQSAGDLTTGCKWFLNNGYDILDRPTVTGVTNTLNGAGAYNVTWDDIGGGFIQYGGTDNPDSVCPTDGVQIGNIQGNDYYFAIYDPTLDQHTLVVLTDPTISASTSGKLWHEPGATNGGGSTLSPNPLNPRELVPDPVSLPETAWYLGQYTHTLTLSGDPPLSDQSFEYSGSKSFPNNDITFQSSSSSHGTTQGFNVGIFGAQGTGGYSSTDSLTTSVSVNVPSWKVSPTPGGRTIGYTWQTNDPVDWSTIAGGGSGSFGLNDLNKADFSPATLTTWTGSATCCEVNVSSTRGLWFVDHYSRWNGNDVVDGFSTNQIQYGDSPNEVLVNTVNPVGPGISLCDPNVMAPSLKDECAGQAPAPTLSIVAACPTAPASSRYSISVNGSPIGGPLLGQTFLGGGGSPVKTFACPQKIPTSISPIRLKPGVDATLSEQVPAGVVEDTVMACFKGDDTNSFVGTNVKKSASVPKITIPAADLARGASIACTFVNKTPG